MANSRRKIPHTWVIIGFLIICSAIATWFVPSGEYSEVISGNTKELVYSRTDANPQSWHIFSAFFKGFVRQSGIIVFILMIGGAFWILNQSAAIEVGIQTFLRRTKKLESQRLFRKIGIHNIINICIMLIFSLFGAVFGMSEETLAFVLILVALAVSMGYDSIVGVCLVYVASNVGFAGAMLNPFTVGIAQGIAGVPLFSGFEYRTFCWLVLTTVTIIWVLLYAKKVKRNPSASVMFNEDSQWRKKSEEQVSIRNFEVFKSTWWIYFVVLFILTVFSITYPFTTLCIGDIQNPESLKLTFPAIPVLSALFALSSYWLLRKSFHFFILNVLLFTIFFLIVGVMGYQWYIMEIASLFLAMGIIAGISMNKSANTIVKLFIEGAADILSAALVVGLAGGIIVILEDGKIIATILHGMSSLLGNSGKVTNVGIMYSIQALINIVIPSGSAKAALTMPVMAPFSDLIGVSRQTTILAFQFGDGFTNMITPTSGVLIGVLGIAKIPFQKWLRWVFPLVLILLLTGMLLLIPPTLMHIPGY